jgi:hypothetical protein
MRNMNLNAAQNQNVEILDDSANNTLLDEQLNENDLSNTNQEGEFYHSEDEQVVQFVS